MTYNVFGGTLNLTHLQLCFLCYAWKWCSMISLQRMGRWQSLAYMSWTTL